MGPGANVEKSVSTTTHHARERPTELPPEAIDEEEDEDEEDDEDEA